MFQHLSPLPVLAFSALMSLAYLHPCSADEYFSDEDTHGSTDIVVEEIAPQTPACFCDDDLYSICPQLALERDLALVSQINACMCDKMPATYNNFLMTGYINMPSALMQCKGMMAAGYSWVPPYKIANVAFQPFSLLECTLNYRIFRNVPDPMFGSMGFGDLADRGVSIKLAILRGEDFGYRLPSLSVGSDDFLGTKGFRSQYIVASQVWPQFNVEASIGYGFERLNGVFGGATWIPWRCSCNPYLNGISLVAEYDSTDYTDPTREKHPDGRNLSHRWNYGIKWRLWDFMDLSVSHVRGEETAFAVSYFYNIGCTESFVPKLDDPLPYCAPVISEPIGCRRTEQVLAEDFVYALREYGFTLREMGIHTYCSGSRELRLVINNCRWLYEEKALEHITELLVALTPDNVDSVVVVCECQGLPVQQYRFCTAYLQAARCKQICRYELEVLSPESEICCPCNTHYHPIYYQSKPWHDWRLAPKTHFLFGSTNGKFKYALGVKACTDGFLFNEVFYRLTLGYIATSSIPPSSHDILNPSQLPNVHTDILTYYRTRDITLDEALLQKNWNMGCGWYSKLAGGYFSQFYAGYSGEVLYYPVDSSWAFGLDAAKLYKRNISGLGFQDRIRQMDGLKVNYIKFGLWQAFVDAYYVPEGGVFDFKVSLGRFLAGDKGGRVEVGHTYPSGMRVMAWYTYTDGHDKVNGNTYHDKGIAVTIPLDLFLTYSCRDSYTHGISAWLRDVGYRTCTGDGLFKLIRGCRRQRPQLCPCDCCCY